MNRRNISPLANRGIRTCPATYHFGGPADERSADDKGAVCRDVEGPHSQSHDRRQGRVSAWRAGRRLRYDHSRADWLLFVDSTRKAPAAPTLTDAESITMMKSHVAWTGKYVTGEQTPEGLRLNSRVDAASSQAISGTERVYFMRLNGNILTMKSPGVIVPMTGQTSIVEFEMVKAD